MEAFALVSSNPPSATELDRIAELRGLVGSSDAKSTDLKLLQFVRAREGDVANAHKMHGRWLSLRREYDLDNITAADVEREMATGKARWHGHDKQQRPCCVVLPRFHDPDTTDEREVVRFVLHMLEEGVRRAEELGQDRVVVLYDRRGMTLKNFDRRLFALSKRVVDIVQICYAERLGACFVVGANWFYWSLFKVIRPFLSEVTRNKIFVLSSPRELLDHFDAKQLAADVFTAVSPDEDCNVRIRAGSESTAQVWLSAGQRASLTWRLQGSMIHRTTTVDFKYDFCGDSNNDGPEGEAAAEAIANVTMEGGAAAPPPTPPPSEAACARDAAPVKPALRRGNSDSTGSAASGSVDSAASDPECGSPLRMGLKRFASQDEQSLEFVAPEDGTLRLTWSNSASYLRAKTVSYRLGVADAGA